MPIETTPSTATICRHLRPQKKEIQFGSTNSFETHFFAENGHILGLDVLGVASNSVAALHEGGHKNVGR
jgi:hypothetical protein